MPQAKHGWSLAELTIVMTLMGVVAVMLVPRVWTLGESQTQRAQFQQALSALERIEQTGLQDGSLTPETAHAVFFSQLKAYKPKTLCPENATKEGCWPASTELGSWGTQPAVVFGNDVTILGLPTAKKADAPADSAILIDLNGARAPNTVGQDQLVMVLCQEYDGCPDTEWTKQNLSLGQLRVADKLSSEASSQDNQRLYGSILGAH